MNAPWVAMTVSRSALILRAYSSVPVAVDLISPAMEEHAMVCEISKYRCHCLYCKGPE